MRSPLRSRLARLLIAVLPAPPSAEEWVDESAEIVWPPGFHPGAYEVSIRMDRGDFSYSTEHSVEVRPDAEILRGLRNEAVAEFEALYGPGEPDEVNVWLTQTPVDEDARVYISED